MFICTVLEMVDTAEYIPYIHLEDLFTSVLAQILGINHLQLEQVYRHVSLKIFARVFLDKNTLNTKRGRKRIHFNLTLKGVEVGLHA